MGKTKFSKIIIKAFEICFSIFFIIILLNTFFRNLATQIEFSKTVMILGTIISITMLYILYSIVKRHSKLYAFEMKRKWKILILLALFIIQFIIALNVYADCGWDCGTLIETATQLHKGEDFYRYYFELNPNNVLIVLIFKLIFTILGCFYTIENYMIIVVIFNLILIDIAFLATITIANKLLGKNVTKLVTLLMLPLIVFSLWMIIPYSDTFTVAIPVILFFLYMKVKEQEKSSFKYLLIALMGILCIVGYYLKPTTIIILIAIVLCEIILGKIDKSEIKTKIKRLGMTAFIFLFAVIISALAIKLWDNIELGKYISKENREKHSLTMTHYMMTGLNQVPVEGTDKFLYGVVNGPDFTGTTSHEGKKAKTEYNITVIKQRLSHLGLTGYIKYLYNKANWILSDGTFFYGGEGQFFTSDTYSQNVLSKVLKPYFQLNTQQYNFVTANIMQISWCIVLFGLIFSVNLKKDEQKKQMEILKFSIIGIIMFILMFEGRARYLINYVPIFIIVSAYGIKNFFNSIDRAIVKIKEKVRR